MRLAKAAGCASGGGAGRRIRTSFVVRPPPAGACALGRIMRDVALPDELTRRLRAVAEGDPDVRALYVFGSRIDGTERPDSDLDVGVVYVSPQPLEKTVRLEEALYQATGEPVDVIDAARAGALLALAVVRGERVFTRDELETDLFDLYVLRRAGDLLPFERARCAMLLGPRS